MGILLSIPPYKGNPILPSYSELISKDIAEQATHVDKQTYNIVLYRESINEKLPERVTKEVYDNFMAQDIANLAFISLYYASEGVRLKCQKFLKELKHYHLTGGLPQDTATHESQLISQPLAGMKSESPTTKMRWSKRAWHKINAIFSKNMSPKAEKTISNIGIGLLFICIIYLCYLQSKAHRIALLQQTEKTINSK